LVVGKYAEKAGLGVGGVIGGSVACAWQLCRCQRSM